MESNPELADPFEDVLYTNRALLKPKIVKGLAGISFLRCGHGKVGAPSSVYLKAPAIVACVGEDALFVSGRHKQLYEILGCLTVPRAVDILRYLEDLRLQNKEPRQPRLLYAQLAEAVRRGELETGQLASRPILWTNQGYASPGETLAGPGLPKAIRSVVPLCPARGLEEAYRTLGANATPTTENWKRFFEQIASKYPSSKVVVDRADRALLVEAYSERRALDAVVADQRVLLDVRGALYSQDDATEGTFLLDDLPSLAKAIHEASLPLGFAVPELYPVASRLGLKKLSDVRGMPRVSVGTEHPAPGGFRGPLGTFQRAMKCGLGEALTSILATRFRLPGLTILECRQRLSAIQQVRFVDSLELLYPIGQWSVPVKGEAWVENGIIYVTPVRNRQEFHDVVAGLLAETCGSELETEDRNALAGFLQRLLGCTSHAEMGDSLRRRGVTWDYTRDQEDAADEEDAPDIDRPDGQRPDSEAFLEQLIENLGAGLQRDPEDDDSQNADGITSSHQPRSEQTSDAGEGTVQSSSAPAPGAPNGASATPVGGADLPEIGDVTLNIEPAQGKHIEPPLPHPRTYSGGSSWSPRSPEDVERDLRTGERGEELVYREEVKRVTALGRPASSVIWTSKTNPFADHDICSVSSDGYPMWIEVKSTLGLDGQFTWPRAEFLKALKEGDRYQLWRVYRAGSMDPIAKRFDDPVAMFLSGSLRLDLGTLVGEVEPTVARDQVDRAPIRPNLSSESVDLGLTPEALDLLAKVDEGGVPLYVTPNLIRIARENGVTPNADESPNSIIAKLQQFLREPKR